MAHLIGALRLARAAAVVNIRETVPDYRYRKSVLIDTVCLALATSRQSQSLAVLRTASHVKPKLPPAETLPWDRKPSLKPNRSMWAKPCVQVADLSFVLDKMTLDSVPRGAVDALADSLSKLSVVDVPCSAVDELSAAFARLTLEDPVVDDLTASFGSMSLEQHSVSLDDLSRVFARCSLEDECGAESTVISELIPMPLGAASTTTNVNLASVNDYEVPATSGIATYINAKSDNEEEVTCLPPPSVSGFTAGDILPHGTSPADWLATAESPQAVDYVRVVDYVRPWIPFAWAQGPMFNVLMVSGSAALTYLQRAHADLCSTLLLIDAPRTSLP